MRCKTKVFPTPLQQCSDSRSEISPMHLNTRVFAIMWIFKDVVFSSHETMPRRYALLFAIILNPLSFFLCSCDE